MATPVKRLRDSLLGPGTQLPDPATLAAEYDQDEDILYIRTPDAGPAVLEPIGEGIWVNIEPDTKQIVGFNIEGFRESFLPSHPEILAGLKPAVFQSLEHPPMRSLGYWVAFRTEQTREMALV